MVCRGEVERPFQFIGSTINMSIEFDPVRRAATLAKRGLDFCDATRLFEGDCLTRPDTRFDYGEVRFVTIGTVAPRVVVLVWTWRGIARRIISMRYANEREINFFKRFPGIRG